MKIIQLADPENGGYVTEDGGTIKREQGLTPNLNPICGRWVYRDANGVFIDMDQYRYDLFERHGFSSFASAK